MEILTNTSNSFAWTHLFTMLTQKMNIEAHLLHQKPEDLFSQFENNLSAVAVDNGEIIGHATLWKIANDWYEIGSTYVCPLYRGRNINFFLYQVLLEKYKEKNIIETTTNRISLHVGEKFGFLAVERNSLPKDVFKGTCICSSKKTGSDNPLLSCQLEWNGISWKSLEKWPLPCHVRVTKETVGRNPCLKIIKNFHDLH